MAMLPPVIASLVADTKEFSAKMAAAQGQMDTFGKSADTAGARFGAFANKAATAIVATGVVVGAYATKLAYDLSTAIDEIGRQSNLTQQQLAQLQPAILKVSNATATGATAIANAYLLTSKAGYSLAESEKAVTSAAQYANAQQTDLNTTLSTALTIQKAGVVGTKSVTQTLDMFTNAIKHSQLSAEDLATALGGRAVSAFAAFRVPLKDALVLLAAFKNQGMEGSKGLMAIRTGLSALDKPMVSSTGKFSTLAKLLATYGLNQQTLASETRRPGGILDVLKQLDTAWQKNATGAQRSAGLVGFLSQVFGSTAGPAFTNVLSQLTSGKLQTLINSINRPGSTQNAFSQWLKTPQGAVRNFEVALQNALIPLGDMILPKLTTVANWAHGVVNYFEAHPLIKTIASDAAIGLFATALVYKIGKGLVTAFQAVKSLFFGTAISANTTATIANTEALVARTGTSAIAAGAAGAGGIGAGEVAVAGGMTIAAAATAAAAVVLPIAAAYAILHFTRATLPGWKPVPGHPGGPRSTFNGHPAHHKVTVTIHRNYGH